MAQSGVSVRIVDERGKDVPSGAIGEIICQSACVIPGYWRDSEATERALRDNWLWTGDMGLMDDDGFLYLMDRSKDMIISGGANIYPREIEEVLLRHPAVQEVAVVGAPDQEWGEVVTAFYVSDSGQEIPPSVLDNLCLDNIARFKRPRRYYSVNSLPKNNYGKILKTRLREKLL